MSHGMVRPALILAVMCPGAARARGRAAAAHGDVRRAGRAARDARLAGSTSHVRGPIVEADVDADVPQRHRPRHRGDVHLPAAERRRRCRRWRSSRRAARSTRRSRGATKRSAATRTRSRRASAPACSSRSGPTCSRRRCRRSRRMARSSSRCASTRSRGYQAGTWELALPMVVAPRYVPGTASGRPTTGTGRAPDTDRAPDASRVTPGGAPGAGGKTAVTLDFDERERRHEPDPRARGARRTRTASSIRTAITTRSCAGSARDRGGWVEQDDDGGYAAVLVEAPPAAARALGRDARARSCSIAPRRRAATPTRSSIRSCARCSAGSPRNDTRRGDRQRSRSRRARPTRRCARSTARGSKTGGAFDLTRVLGRLRAAGAPVVARHRRPGRRRSRPRSPRRRGSACPVHVIGVGPAPNRALLDAARERDRRHRCGSRRSATICAALARDVLADVATAPASARGHLGHARRDRRRAGDAAAARRRPGRARARAGQAGPARERARARRSVRVRDGDAVARARGRDDAARRARATVGAPAARRSRR